MTESWELSVLLLTVLLAGTLYFTWQSTIMFIIMTSLRLSSNDSFVGPIIAIGGVIILNFMLGTTLILDRFGYDHGIIKIMYWISIWSILAVSIMTSLVLAGAKSHGMRLNRNQTIAYIMSLVILTMTMLILMIQFIGG